MAATYGHNVASLALAMPVGPFGLLYRRAAWPQPIYDESSEKGGSERTVWVYPLFHVVRFLSQLSGARRLQLYSLPREIVGVAARGDQGTRVLLANLTDEPANVRLPGSARGRLLSQETFGAAIANPHWLEAESSQECSQISLGAFNVAFIELRENAT